MDCREYHLDMWPYLNGELEDYKIEKFLKHIDSCPECREELKIHFFISEGFKRLEDEGKGYNLVNDFEIKLNESNERCQKIKMTNFIIMCSSFGLLIFILFILLSSLFAIL